MINLKPQIKNALESNDLLITLLSGPRIYQLKAPDADEFPRITFFEFDNFGSLFADDAEASSEIHIQIDIWSKESTSAISDEIDNTMKKLDFARTSAVDLYEEDTKVFHKAMRYSTIVEI